MRKLVIFVVVLLVAMGGVYAFFTWREWFKDREQTTEADISIPLTGEKGAEERRVAKIYFPSPVGRYLRVEERLLPAVGYNLEEPQALAKALMEQLLKEPPAGGNTTIPKGTELLDVFLDGRGSLYLDFSADLKKKHVPGAWAEALTVYSVVNTAMANIRGVERVYILIDGAEADTLGGHIALSQPFKAQPAMMGPAD